MFSSYSKAYAPPPYNILSANYAANNKYKGFPPKMSDNRALIASTQPVSVVDYYLRGNQTNWSYREHLTKNAEHIRNVQLSNSLNDIGYYQRFMDNIEQYPATTGAIAPAFFTSIFDNQEPLGTQISDNKTKYLSREQLNSRLVMPKVYIADN